MGAVPGTDVEEGRGSEDAADGDDGTGLGEEVQPTVDNPMKTSAIPSLTTFWHRGFKTFCSGVSVEHDTCSILGPWGLNRRPVTSEHWRG